MGQALAVVCFSLFGKWRRVMSQPRCSSYKLTHLKAKA
jgi:hypothetical protein